DSSFFFSSRTRHTRFSRDWSSDVCSSDLDFKNRMRGEGEFAKLLQQRYRIALKRLQLERHRESWPQLDCSRFIKPRKPSVQGELDRKSAVVGKECRCRWAPHEETGPCDAA